MIERDNSRPISVESGEMMQNLLKQFMEATAKVNQTLTELADIGIEKQQLIIANEVKELDSLMRKEGHRSF